MDSSYKNIGDIIKSINRYIIMILIVFIVFFLVASSYFFKYFDEDVLDKNTADMFESKLTLLEKRIGLANVIFEELEKNNWVKDIISKDEIHKSSQISGYIKKDITTEYDVFIFNTEGKLVFKDSDKDYIGDLKEGTKFIENGEDVFLECKKQFSYGGYGVIWLKKACPIENNDKHKFSLFLISNEDYLIIDNSLNIKERDYLKIIDKSKEGKYDENFRYHWYLKTLRTGEKILILTENYHNSRVYGYFIQALLLIIIGMAALWLLIKKKFKPIVSGIVLSQNELNSKLYEKTEQLETVLDSLSDPVNIKNLDGNYTVVNQSFADLMGYSKEEIYSKKDSDIFNKDEVKFLRKIEGDIINEKNPISYMRWKESDVFGKRLYGCKKNLYYNNINEPIGFVTISRDITDDKKREEHLEMEIMKNVRKLAVAEKLLMEQEKSAAVAELLSGFMHDLNNQIGVTTTTSSYLEDKVLKLVEKYKEGLLKKSDFDYLMNVLEESLTLIRSNLELAKNNIENFKVINDDQSSNRIRRIDLSKYIEEVIENWKPRLKKKGHKINLVGETGIILETQPGLIASVINNLIDNSLKHGFVNNKKGLINIEIKKNKDIIYFYYKDNGAGIKKEVIDRVFDAYFTTSKEGGTGLGLSIIKDVIEKRLNGIIRFGQQNKGFSIEIEIPN